MLVFITSQGISVLDYSLKHIYLYSLPKLRTGSAVDVTDDNAIKSILGGICTSALRLLAVV